MSISTNFMKRFALWFWGIFAAGFLAVLLVIFGISMGWIGYMPDIKELQNPQNRFASELFTSDGQWLGRYFRGENRIGIQYKDIPTNLVNALVATEDARYYEHSGVDGKALVRALASLGKKGGGSTLTQQLAKQLYSETAHSTFERLLQKPIEWIIAIKLERLYSKEEILTMYLNQFDFLYNAVGIKSAAYIYFGKTPLQLNVEECALLVGMCKNPSYYNPIRYQERALLRRNTVLEQMEKYDYLTHEECESYKQKPIVVSFHKVDHKDGLAPYFREFLRNTLTAQKPKESDYPEWKKNQYPIDMDKWENDPMYGWCNKNTKADGTPYDLYHDGLKIYTTIDSRMQKYAEEAVVEWMEKLQEKFFARKKGQPTAPFTRKLSAEQIEQSMLRTMKQTDRYRELKKAGRTEEEILKIFNTPRDMQVFSYKGLRDTTMSPMDSIRYQKFFLRCGFMSMDPHNGHVKAYVGGPDFTYFQYDMVNGGKRQVGSTIKPYVYTLAMSNGYWPCDKLWCHPIVLRGANGKAWTPKGSGTGWMTLRHGLQTSNNWMSFIVMNEFTPDQLVDLMKSFGIEGPINNDVTICLGSCEISVREMVSAYSTFPNKGIRCEPLYVTRIEDSNGSIVANFQTKTYEVIDEWTSYKMIDIMRAVVDAGTGRRMRHTYGIKTPMGGKTGTTNANSDGWFMCYTPSLVNGCWVGGEERTIRFDNTADGQGASMALPICGIYLQKVFADPSLGYKSDEQFDIPSTFNPNEGCLNNYTDEGSLQNTAYQEKVEYTDDSRANE